MDSQQASCVELFYVLQALNQAWEGEEHQLSRAQGLNRTDLKVLSLVQTQEHLTSGQLAATLGLSTAGISAVLDRLEAKDLIERKADETDRRRVVILLGSKFAPHLSAQRQIAEKLQRVCTRLDETELHHLIGTLHMVLDEFISHNPSPVLTSAFSKEP